jgi:hypothetical protein
LTSDRPKHFWETLGGTMAGTAALLTAITGVFLARHQLQQNSQTNCPPVSSTASQSKSAETDERDRSEFVSATERSSSMLVTPQKDFPLESEVAIERQPRRVALPVQREYTIGESYTKFTYMLLDAKLVPRTPESDALTIRIRLMNRSGRRGTFRSAAFSLLNDGHAIVPEQSFQKDIPDTEFADQDVLFVIPAALPSATLRIENYMYNKEIPLDLTPPPPT